MAFSAVTLNSTLEGKCKEIIGGCYTRDLTPHDFTNYSPNAHLFLKRVYSCLLNDIKHSSDYLFKDIDTKTVGEPIYLIKTERDELVHVFNYQLIAEYFNSASTVRIKLETEADNNFVSYKNNAILKIDELRRDNEGRKVDKPTMLKLLRLYVLADHAAEHFYNYFMKDNVDNNHEQFRTVPNYLSSIISSTPNKSTHEHVFGRVKNAKAKLMYTFPTNKHQNTAIDAPGDPTDDDEDDYVDDDECSDSSSDDA